MDGLRKSPGLPIPAGMDPQTKAQSKQLMRFLLAYHLGGAPLNTRQILIDLMQL